MSPESIARGRGGTPRARVEVRLDVLLDLARDLVSSFTQSSRGTSSVSARSRSK
jgi:hypothetical protein